MLKIRLQRTGKKHEPTFRVVLTDSKNSTKSGKFLEILGSYDPREKNEARFKEDRIKHWISVGAKPSDTLHNLFITKGIIKGEKINVLPKKSPIVKEGEEKAEVASPEADAKETPVETEASVPEEKPEVDADVKETPAPEVKEEDKSEDSKEETPTEEKKEDSVEEK